MSAVPPPAYAISTVEEMKVSLQNILLELDGDNVNTLIEANLHLPELAPLLYNASSTYTSLYNLVERRRYMERMVKEMKKDEERMEDALVKVAQAIVHLDARRRLVFIPRPPTFTINWHLGNTTGPAHLPIPQYLSPHNNHLPPNPPAYVPRSPTPPPFKEISSEPDLPPVILPSQSSSSSSLLIPLPVLANLRDAHDSSPSEEPVPPPTSPVLSRRQRERRARELRR